MRWVKSQSAKGSTSGTPIHVWGPLFFLIFCPIKVTGQAHLLKEKNMIFAANHASYLDPFVLLTVLPENTIFIVKKELMKLPMISRVMKKLNYMTVDRWEFAQNIEDTKRIQHLCSRYLLQARDIIF